MSKISIQKTFGSLAVGLLIAVPALSSAQRYDRRDRQELQRDRREIERDRRELRRDQRGLAGGPRDDRRYNGRDDRWYGGYDDRRRDTKNEWRDLGAVSGAVGVYGLLSGNRTLAALGLGGGLYSAYRYEEDRRSDNRYDRDRYELFRRPSFDYQGHHYTRHERSRDGQRYYSFSRDR